MKIIPILRKLESFYLKETGKQSYHNEIKKGKAVSLIYYDIDKEHTKIHSFGGICKKFRSKGINTKISVRVSVRRIHVQQEFFFYSKVLLDAGVLSKKK